jgi:hypothetical protein
MGVRLRRNGCVMAGASCVVALAFVLLDRAPAAAQISAERVLERVSRYVEDYFRRAQSLMVEETVIVQETGGDLMPQGFARTLVYDLRFEWRLDADNGEPRVNVVRELLRANRRPVKPKDEPKCLDPAPVTPEPLEFLLPGRHADFTFAGGSRTLLDGEDALLIEYMPRASAKATTVATLDPKGTGDKDCITMDVQRRNRGRIWIDPATAAVRRIDENLLGPTDVPLPREAQRRSGFGGGLYITLRRSDSSVRYEPVTFSDPDETLMLPTTIENVWVAVAGSVRGVRMTQQYRNYRRFLTESRIVTGEIPKE